ncbi:MAG TPA: HYExAFE family protein [Planctomycetia bacterium]|nr:HYExAFE family protein [Planctomycetia bacterium]
MADRSNHYERAFADYVRARRLSCLPVDESRRAVFGDQTLKSPDYLVAVPGRGVLLVDVKGRRLKGRGIGLENWVTIDDLASLVRWRGLFPSGSASVLAFVYWLPDAAEGERWENFFEFEGRRYGMLAIGAEDYVRIMRCRSAKWKTFAAPRERFRGAARPFTDWLAPLPEVSHAG